MKDYLLTQVKLRRGNEWYTAYIPSEFAKPGAVVKIWFENEWIDGWVVDEMFNSLPVTYVVERSQDYKRTRKASDI